MTDEDFNRGLQDKLLGQIRLALTGQHFLNDGGSITLISGIIAHEPIAQGANAATINAGLEGFVRAAACELERGQRINLISPTVLSESAEAYDDFFRALKVCPPPPSPTPIAAVWKASKPGVFIKSVTDKALPCLLRQQEEAGSGTRFVSYSRIDIFHGLSDIHNAVNCIRHTLPDNNLCTAQVEGSPLLPSDSLIPVMPFHSIN